ncbi:putative alpha/beta fold family hydrolase [Phaeosphaeriaceae sp. PMI808]|nr:putative alpha/beta fold family hydrolase [Phaeosphaeriaceae sp. PMI808]
MLKNRFLLGAVTAATCFFLYTKFRPLLLDQEDYGEEDAIIRARPSSEVDHWDHDCKRPYRKDAFPGSRQFRTIYGTIQIFEWGPEDGEKVLLVHGLGTPCVALGDMAKEFVRKGYRIMMFDLFGRGYSDTPGDLHHDARLYTTQMLLVLSSSPLSWTGSSAFHLVGFSLGGSISVAFAAYHATMLLSMTLIAPGGLIRKSHISRHSDFLYSSALLPEWLRLKLIRNSLEPRHGVISAENPDEVEQADVDFDDVPIGVDRPHVKIGDVIRWQLDHNPGFVRSYLSTVRSALVYCRHDNIWRVLGDELARRRSKHSPPGLPGGRICLILARKDVVVVTDELIKDMSNYLRAEDIDVYMLDGGHEIAVSRGKDVASIAMKYWAQTID